MTTPTGSESRHLLEGQRAVIIGASRGLGRAVAEAFADAGASLMLVAREEAPLIEVSRDCEIRAQSGQVALWHAADISRPSDVESMVQRAVQAFGSIDILVCNAGVIGAIGPVETTDWDDWVTAIQVNLLGTVLCCRSVVPIMRQQQHGKIIALSGGGATSPIAGFSAYGASKAGLVRFIETLAVELEGTGIDVNAVAPGTLDTQMLDQTLEAGPERLSPDFLARSKAQKASGGTPLQIPANLITFLASSRSNGITGRLISAVWDDWEHLAERKEQLRTSDVFTLRRIVPSDRGWDG